MLATISSNLDKPIRVWDIAGVRPRLLWCADQPRPLGAAFSPDGRILVTGNYRHEVKFWDVRSGKQLLSFEAHEDSIWSVALSPDGRLLAVAAYKPTVKVWDVSGITGRRPLAAPAAPSQQPSADTPQQSNRGGALNPKELEALWSDLANKDATRAYRAIWALVEAPQPALPFLAGRIQPVPLPDGARTERLLADLNSNSFEIRQKAKHELSELGDRVTRELRRELEHPRSPEVRRQVANLLEEQVEGPLTLDRLRDLRALEVLEHVGTPEAQRLLFAIAQGAPEAHLTQEARFALKRLAVRPATP
jgi:hypothetical protein